MPVCVDIAISHRTTNVTSAYDENVNNNHPRPNVRLVIYAILHRRNQMPNARLCIREMYHRRLQSFQCLVDAFIFSQQFEQMTGTVYSRDARCRPLCLFCTVLLLLIHVLLANYVYYIDYARV